MKIAYIAHIRLPTERAHGYATMKLCEEFARAGHEVELIVPDKWAPALKEKDPFIYYAIERNFKLRRIFSTDFLGKEDGRGRIAFWLDLLSFIYIAKWLCGDTLRAADVVYTRDFRLVGFLPCEKIVLEVHDIPAQTEQFAQAVKAASHVIAISNGLKQAIETLGVKKEILVAPDAVDMRRFLNVPAQQDARKALGLPQKIGAYKKIALYAGHFYPWKGADIFAEAAIRLPDIHGVLVGGVEPDFEVIKQKYGQYVHIDVRPFQPPPLMPLYYAAADVLVLPNSAKEKISSSYTSPLKLFEYMASGKPIVASDLPSIREIVDEHTALLVKPDSPKALADGIQKVLDDPALAARLGTAAKAKVEGYTWPARARAVVDFINPAREYTRTTHER